ncbi:MAG: hypothetical protein AAFQ02_00395 [Bacteroidota bacterium]
MKKHITCILMCILICLGCETKEKLKDWTPEQLNLVLSQVDTADPSFTQKEVAFDSIITLAGVRILGQEQERIKFKLFHFGPYVRGYYNLADRDDKNLQVFGKRIDSQWVMKCVTKLSMTEADGYLLLLPSGKSIWSNGSVGFEQGYLQLQKQATDYNDLVSW